MSGPIVDRVSTERLHEIVSRSNSIQHDVSVWGGASRTQVHHVIPVEKASEYRAFFTELSRSGYRFDVNDASNLVALPNSIESARIGETNNRYASIHFGGDTQHKTYSDQIGYKLQSIRQNYESDLAQLGPKAAAELAGQRIDALKSETMDLLTGPTKASVKLFLNNNDPILLEQYKAANPSTGPPEYDSNGRMTKEWRDRLADFQAKNYDLIDFNRAPSFLDASTTRSVNTILDNKPSGAVGTAALAITGASVVKMLKDKYGDLSPEQIATMVRSMGIDPKALLGVAGEIGAEAALQILARTLGGPVAIAVSAYDLYQNFASLRDALKLYEDAFDSQAVGKLNAAIDAAEAKVKALVGSRPDRKLTPEQVEQVNREIEKATGLSLIDQCFAAGTPILMADGSVKVIEAARANSQPVARSGLITLRPSALAAALHAVSGSAAHRKGKSASRRQMPPWAASSADSSRRARTTGASESAARTSNVDAGKPSNEPISLFSHPSSSAAPSVSAAIAFRRSMIAARRANGSAMTTVAARLSQTGIVSPPQGTIEGLDRTARPLRR